MCCTSEIARPPDNQHVCCCRYRTRPRRFGRRFVFLSLQCGLPRHFPRMLHLPRGRLATENLLPSMISRMAFFHGDKNSATRCANFSTRGECSFNGRAVVSQIDNISGKKHRIIRRRWPEQSDCILCRDSARRVIFFRMLHQMIGGRPIAMAIEQRADDAAIQYSLKSFVFFLWFPLCDNFAIFWETPDM